MKQKIITILENYGLEEYVRFTQPWGIIGYVVKVKDGDGESTPYNGHAKLIRKALSYNDYDLIADDIPYNPKTGEYSFTIKKSKKEVV